MKSKLKIEKLLYEMKRSLKPRHEQQLNAYEALKASHKFRFDLSLEARSTAISFSEDGRIFFIQPNGQSDNLVHSVLPESIH